MWELNYKLTTLPRRNITDSSFHDFMARPKPFWLLQNHEDISEQVTPSLLHKDLRNLIFQKCNAKWMLAFPNKNAACQQANKQNADAVTYSSCYYSSLKIKWLNLYGPLFLFLPWVLGSSESNFMLQLFIHIPDRIFPTLPLWGFQSLFTCFIFTVFLVVKPLMSFLKRQNKINYLTTGLIT